MTAPGKTLFVAGLLIAAAGLAFMAAGKLGLGQLPGDIVLRRGKLTMYFPFATGLFLSLVATLLFHVFRQK